MKIIVSDQRSSLLFNSGHHNQRNKRLITLNPDCRNYFKSVIVWGSGSAAFLGLVRTKLFYFVADKEVQNKLDHLTFSNFSSMV
jgi:hypothetical protein